MAGQSNRIQLANYMLGQQASTYGKNYVLNTSALMNAANVTASGASLSRSTTTPLTAIADFSISLGNNATDTVTWSTSTLDRSVYGRNCELRFDYTASSIGSNVVAQVLQGSTVISQTQALTVSTVTRGMSLNAPCGDGSSATTIVIRNASGNSGTSSMRVANVTYGLATNISSAAVITDWQSYTPTLTNLPLSSSSMRWRRVGDSMEIQGTITLSGTGSAGEARVSLPSGYTIDANKVPSIRDVGRSVSSSSSFSSPGWQGVILAEASTAYVTFGRDIGGQSAFTKLQGNDSAFAALIYTVNGLIPITEFATNATQFTPPNNNTDWIDGGAITVVASGGGQVKGTATTDKVWWRRNGSNLELQYNYQQTTGGTSGTGDYLFSIPSAAGCTIDTSIVPVNTGIGNSVSVADNKSVVGSASAGITGTNAAVGVSMVYSTTQLRFGVRDSAGAATAAVGQTNYNFGSANLSYAAQASVPCVGWTNTVNAPVIVGSVTSASTVAERIERTTITNNGTASIASQSGNWLTSVTRNGTGDLTLNITSGMFSGTPTCTCNVIQNVALPFIACTFKTLSSTAVRFQAAVTSSGAATDQDMTVICMGPRST